MCVIRCGSECIQGGFILLIVFAQQAKSDVELRMKVCYGHKFGKKKGSGWCTTSKSVLHLRRKVSSLTRHLHRAAQEKPSPMR